MNWRIGDILYEKDLPKVKGDGQLHLVGHITKLIPNEHGAMQHAMVRPKRGAKSVKVRFNWEKHVVLLPNKVIRTQLPEEIRTFLGANPMLVAIRAPLGSKDAVQFWSNRHGGVVHQVLRSEEAGELQFNTKFPDSGLYVHSEGTGDGDSFFAVEGEQGWQQVELEELEDDPEVIY